MSKMIWKPGTMIYPLPAVLVTCGTFEKANILTVAWTGTVCTEPAMTYISIRPERYSYQLIHETKQFVINLTNKDLAWATDWCGVKSGKEVDKFKECHLTKEKANFVECPLIKESPLSIECEVVEEKKLGSHVMFLAKVLGIDADEKYFEEDGRFAFEKSDPIAYSHGKYYTLGENIGKFGFSVKK